jgi:hypothetical protein
MSHFHYGKICVKLVGFKEQKKYFVFLKRSNLPGILLGVNTSKGGQGTLGKCFCRFYICDYVPVTMCLWLCACDYVPVTMWLWLCLCLSMSLQRVLSQFLTNLLDPLVYSSGAVFKTIHFLCNLQMA